jgi:hypothetical protein
LQRCTAALIAEEEALMRCAPFEIERARLHCLLFTAFATWEVAALRAFAEQLALPCALHF